MSVAEYHPLQSLERGESKEQTIFGGKRASGFIKDVVAGKVVTVGKEEGVLDITNPIDLEKIVYGIHDRVSMVPGLTAELRQTDSTTIGGEPVKGRYQELPYKLRNYCIWLSEQLVNLKENPENLVLALEIAAAAHYGFTRRDFHPFDNGNGRTARAISNIILMSQSYELTAHGYAIPPIPIVRDRVDDQKYNLALNLVEETRSLNPLMIFLAHRWADQLNDPLNKIMEKVHIHDNNPDVLLALKLKERQAKLLDFIKNGVPPDEVEDHHKKRTQDHINGKRQYKIFPVPDYVQTRLVRFDHFDKKAS